MNESALALKEKTAVETVNVLSVDNLLQQVAIIKEVSERVMKSGLHYGTIPGCGSKPTLLKPGAEVLALTFQWAPKYEIEIDDMGDGHKNYDVTCQLYTRQHELYVGSGIGSCSTMETKWRFRSESTGKDVPPAYWKSKDPYLLGGPEYSTRKVSGKWLIYKKVPHDNPADYYNTCKKMAKKRAFVDAILTCTGASEAYTQDIEDLADNGVMGSPAKSAGSGSSNAKAKPKPAAKPAAKKTSTGSGPIPSDEKILASQLKMLTGKAEAKGVSVEEVCKFFVVDKLEDLPREKVGMAMDYLDGAGGTAA
jgi:hypothetical protein